MTYSSNATSPMLEAAAIPDLFDGGFDVKTELMR